MTESPSHRVVVIGPDGQPVGFADVPNGSSAGEEGSTDGEEREDQFDPADAIGEPAKVMRIGTMIKQLLEEVRAAPLDEASRLRLKETHARSILELSLSATNIYSRQNIFYFNRITFERVNQLPILASFGANLSF
jgi:hypothetical protein